MAKTIAIQLEIDGAQQAVKTIGELETAIEQLTEELKQTDIGSERFNQLTVELNSARSALKGFEQTFEGLDPQQQTQAYLAFGESVVSGILLAQEAIRAFGIENESVNNAVEKSTQAINLALQTRIIIEGALEARVIATTIAQRALNTATVTGNKVLKALFTTMAANPLGAVLAAIGLLVTAFILLSEGTEESTKAFGENEDAQRDLELQSRATARAIDGLRQETDLLLKQYESFDLSQTTQELNSVQEELNNLTQSQSEVRNFGQSIGELGNDILAGVVQIKDLNLTLAEQRELLDVAEDALTGYIGSFGSPQVESNITSIKNLIEILQNSISEAEGETDALTKRLEFLQKRLEDLKKARSAKALDGFVESLEDASKAVEDLNRNLLEFGDIPEPPVIEDLKELLALQLKLREAAEENRKTLSDTFTDYVTSVDEAKNETDTFGQEVERIRKELTSAFLTGDIEVYGAKITEVQDAFLSEENVNKFTKEQKAAITQILSGYEVAFKSLKKLGIDTEDEFKNIINPLLDGLTNKLQLEGSINFQEVNGAIQEFQLSVADIEEGTIEFYNKRQELIDNIREELLKEAELNKLNAEDREKAIENATKLSEEQADAIIEIITNTAKAEDAIRGVLFETQQLTQGIQDTSNDFDEFFGLVITNFDSITEEFDVTKLLDPDPAKLDENLNALTDFFKDVSNDQINLEEFTQEQRIELLEEFLEKRKELIEKNTKEEEDIQKQSLEETLGNLQEVLSSISEVGAALAENSQFQISVIQRETEALLDEVVGDTKEAAELREEIQEDATRKIVELERQAELRSLQFAKIEAISQLAVATVRALALPPPFNAIAAAAVGTAGSLQIGLIQSQIEDLKSVPGFAQGGVMVLVTPYLRC
jgi:chromosome segregation ATPase